MKTSVLIIHTFARLRAKMQLEAQVADASSRIELIIDIIEGTYIRIILFTLILICNLGIYANIGNMPEKLGSKELSLQDVLNDMRSLKVLPPLLSALIPYFANILILDGFNADCGV